MREHSDDFNPIWMMARSGARGNESQLSQLAGMRGLVADPTGKTIEIPIKANFREGLTVLEILTLLTVHVKVSRYCPRTADSGYLTRRLVDVAQDVIVREVDCGTEQGVMMRAITDVGRDIEQVIEPLSERLTGRVAAAPIVHPETGEVLVEANQLIDEDMADAVESTGIEEAEIRSALTCRTRHGVCARCYGRNLATGKLVEVGEAIGTIAAQSIGEPGTQLTMRTFHTGGVAGDDITAGLPRVEELFEARKPKGQAIITEVTGTVSITESKGVRKAIVTTDDGEERAILFPMEPALRSGKVARGGRGSANRRFGKSP